METQKKLLINHVAKRLPYGLKFIAGNKEFQITSVSYLNPNYQIWANNYWDEIKLKFYPEINVKDSSLGRGFNINEIKPILMPSSSLTETITIKGKSFVPIEVLKSNSETPYASSFRLEENNFVFDTQLMDSSYGAHKWEDVTFYCGNQLEMFEKLIEWHIDLPHENLIEKGLAISVFDLTENPYA